MSELASAGQLRMSLLRWILVCVPAIVALGSLSGILSNSGYGNRWFTALHPADIMPPGWVFASVWTLLYVLMGWAFAMILNARGARARGQAITVFLVQLAANFAWSPLFFGMRQVSAAFYLIIAILILTVVTALLFARIRRNAGLLMVPYILWLCFASFLNFQIDQRNPDAETLAPPAASANIRFGQGL
jgi:tryptophan-rich sensory protein